MISQKLSLPPGANVVVTSARQSGSLSDRFRSDERQRSSTAQLFSQLPCGAHNRIDVVLRRARSHPGHWKDHLDCRPNAAFRIKYGRSYPAGVLQSLPVRCCVTEFAYAPNLTPYAIMRSYRSWCETFEGMRTDVRVNPGIILISQKNFSETTAV